MTEQPSSPEDKIVSNSGGTETWLWSYPEDNPTEPPPAPPSPKKYVFRIPRPDTKKTHAQYVRELEPDPVKAKNILKYEKEVIEAQRTRLRDEFFNVWQEMRDMDKQVYAFYEIHKAGSFTEQTLANTLLKGIKVELVGLFRCDPENGTYFLLSHDAQDKTIANPAKVLLDFERLKDPPTVGAMVDLKGLCFWKDGKSVVDVHSFSVIYPHAVDHYINFLREVKLCAQLKRHCAARRGDITPTI